MHQWVLCLRMKYYYNFQKRIHTGLGTFVYQTPIMLKSRSKIPRFYFRRHRSFCGVFDLVLVETFWRVLWFLRCNQCTRTSIQYFYDVFSVNVSMLFWLISPKWWYYIETNIFSLKKKKLILRRLKSMLGRFRVFTFEVTNIRSLKFFLTKVERVFF